MTLNEIKIALADLYLINIEKNKQIQKLTEAGDKLAKQLTEKEEKEEKEE